MFVRFMEPNDAKYILNWIENEREFRLWSADQYKEYPIKPSELLRNYKAKMEKGAFYPLVFVEKFELVGHLILRYPTDDQKLMRLGFIIIKNNFRGRGNGKKMILEAIEFARTNFGIKKFNLGVFTSNINAVKCYESVGFVPTKFVKNEYKFYDEMWDWQEMTLE